MTALNAELKTRWWLWTSKLKSDDGSERQTENSDGSEHQNWKAMMTLNAKTENSDDSERQN